MPWQGFPRFSVAGASCQCSDKSSYIPMKDEEFDRLTISVDPCEHLGEDYIRKDLDPCESS